MPTVLAPTLLVKAATRFAVLLLPVMAVGATLPPSSAAAQSMAARQNPGPVLATVNGRQLFEKDLALADAEIGADLGALPDATRRRVLVEYLIETQLMADAAESASLGQGATFDQRLQYWRRKALRDSYFDNKVKAMITEADARRSFDEQVGTAKGGVELKTSHILVDSEDKAKDLFEQLGHGGDFAALARQHSIDPGSRNNGGSLGYFTRGQMVPQFENAAFKLDKGDVSLPVKSQFGWHLIRLEDKRERRPPDFDAVKGRITAALVHQKAQDILDGMRAKAKIEYIDPVVKAQVEADLREGQAARR